MSEKRQTVQLIWRITYAHTIAYFFAGIFAMQFLNYGELFETVFSAFMRPTTDPIIYLGSSLQIIRGILKALFLLPLRKAFFEEKYGLLKLGAITIGLSYLFTVGPGIGSFEGFIFTTIPVRYQLVGLPEVLVWVALFIGILHISQKYAHKRIITILAIIIIVFIVFTSVGSFLYQIS